MMYAYSYKVPNTPECRMRVKTLEYRRTSTRHNRPLIILGKGRALKTGIFLTQLSHARSFRFCAHRGSEIHSVITTSVLTRSSFIS